MKVDFLIVGFGIAGASIAHINVLVKINLLLLLIIMLFQLQKFLQECLHLLEVSVFITDNYDVFFDFALNFYKNCQLHIGFFNYQKEKQSVFLIQEMINTFF